VPWLADMLTISYSMGKQELPLERSSQPPYIISVAQFRPEKVHNLLQYFFELFIFNLVDVGLLLGCLYSCEVGVLSTLPIKNETKCGEVYYIVCCHTHCSLSF
jgi:hypothetical protein